MQSRDINQGKGPNRVRILFLAGLILAFIQVVFVFKNTYPTQHHFRLPATGKITASKRPEYSARMVTRGSKNYVHNVAVVEQGDGHLRAFWYGGSREGAGDVTIRSALYNQTSKKWTDPVDIIGRVRTQETLRRFVKKLGNMVVLRDPQGDRLWLFYVAVSVGGWSGSSVNLVVSDDHGKTWSEPVRLVSSPVLNVSTLVKGTPFFYEDGTIGLPVYHEFAGKFAELLRVNREGQVLRKSRISRGRISLQPVVVPRDKSRALALMRFSGKRPRRILQSHTSDGGLTWSKPQKSSLKNPNAAVAAIRLPDQSVLLVFNNTEKGRYDLSLAQSRDEAKSWKLLHRFEDASKMDDEARDKQRFAYPWLMQTSDGRFHLFYTWHNRHIKHVSFNRAWLRGKQ